MLTPILRLTTHGVKVAVYVTTTLLIVGTVTFTVTRLRATYRIQYAQAALSEEFQRFKLNASAVDEDLSARVNALEKAVYAFPREQAAPTTTASSGPFRPAQWQLNRDAELRKRLEAQERARLDLIAEIERLKQQIRELQRTKRDGPE